MRNPPLTVPIDPGINVGKMHIQTMSHLYEYNSVIKMRPEVHGFLGEDELLPSTKHMNHAMRDTCVICGSREEVRISSRITNHEKKAER